MNRVNCTIKTLREFIKNELTYLYPEKEIASLTDLLFENILNIPRHKIHFEPQKEISHGCFNEFRLVTQNVFRQVNPFFAQNPVYMRQVFQDSEKVICFA